MDSGCLKEAKKTAFCWEIVKGSDSARRISIKGSILVKSFKDPKRQKGLKNNCGPKISWLQKSIRRGNWLRRSNSGQLSKANHSKNISYHQLWDLTMKKLLLHQVAQPGLHREYGGQFHLKRRWYNNYRSSMRKNHLKWNCFKYSLQ